MDEHGGRDTITQDALFNIFHVSAKNKRRRNFAVLFTKYSRLIIYHSDLTSVNVCKEKGSQGHSICTYIQYSYYCSKYATTIATPLPTHTSSLTILLIGVYFFRIPQPTTTITSTVPHGTTSFFGGPPSGRTPVSIRRRRPTPRILGPRACRGTGTRSIMFRVTSSGIWNPTPDTKSLSRVETNLDGQSQQSRSFLPQGSGVRKKNITRLHNNNIRENPTLKIQLMSPLFVLGL